MKKTGNQSYLKAINQRSVLDAIFSQGPISKAALARLLKLSKPTMADNVGRLMEMDIIKELGEDNNIETRGRRPTLLSFNGKDRYIITIDFYYQKTYFYLFNLEGQTLSEFSVCQTPQHDFESWVKVSITALHMLVASQNITEDQLVAIGISSPGIIRDGAKTIIKSQMYGAFDPQTLYHAVCNTFNCAVYIKNSTNASAMGEWAEGAGKSSKNMLYISCGMGLGMGIIANGKLYEGSKVAAGEIGNVVYPNTVNEEKTLENRICIAGLLDTFKKEAPLELTQNRPHHLGEAFLFDDFVKLWKSGDDFAKRLIDNIALELGCVVCNSIMAFNCDLVVLGGEYAVFFEQMLPYINKLVKKKCFLPAPVFSSKLKEKAANIGMATMCRDLYFDYICGVKLERRKSY